MPVLTAVDVLGIQRYVFGSSRLRDVLASSWMVSHVTEREQLVQWAELPSSAVLLAAGGNAIIEFDTIEQARDWSACYSRWLHETAPGLDVVVAHRPYEAQSLAWALRVLQVDVARAKYGRAPNMPQLGLSVTASCSNTGLPATNMDHGELVSSGVHQLRMCVDNARARWANFVSSLEPMPGWRADFPDEIDHMGRTYGQSSLVGVVHVDGNGVGRRIKRWLERCLEQGTDDESIRAQYHEWSDAIDRAGHSALLTAVRRVASCIQIEDDHCVLRGTPVELGYRLHDWRDDRTHRRARQTVLLPLRPVLLGGDDLTFLCDARIALDLAAATLQEFERHEIPHLGDDGASTTLTACAGVALVKAHAPFHRSYEIAEDLCRNAKRARTVANQDAAMETGGWLDWHIGTTRPGESVAQIREREYSRGNIELTMRPFPVTGPSNRIQTWAWLDNELLGPPSDGGARGLRGAHCWAGSRNRVKALGSVVVGGAHEVERQIGAWRATESTIQLPGALDDSGYLGQKTPLLDAVEMFDLHLRLKPDFRVAGTASEPSGNAAEEMSR
ncbi:hypothetical protein DL240_15190 [Lujinxingia litoralis]|uniref:GGDEF domain-containing protein n=1 Tax=Lujinxingia litoralis TaxID=2211119 RepID=A0A328C225_9DELT|nr:hypothetical protein DL240_15190 [Lujinxingia litoralis]